MIYLSYFKFALRQESVLGLDKNTYTKSNFAIYRSTLNKSHKGQPHVNTPSILRFAKQFSLVAA